MMRPTMILLAATSAVAWGCSDGQSDDAVWSSSVSELVLVEAGGFLPPSKPTAECPFAGSEYRFEVASRTLAASRCTPGPTDPWPLRKQAASRSLTDAEFSGLVEALEALEVVHADTCGADKPELTLTVTTSSGAREYRDSFYACDADPRPTVDTEALDGVKRAFAQLAFGDAAMRSSTP